jgi:hypothetical protein
MCGGIFSRVELRGDVGEIWRQKSLIVDVVVIVQCVLEALG